MASSYDAWGAARVLEDGLTPSRLISVQLSLQNVRVSGGRATALVAKQGSGDATELMGNYDAETGELTFEPGGRAFFFGAPELLQQLGGRADDGVPQDGIANEWVGFVGTSSGAVVKQGRFIATAQLDTRPDPIDGSKVSAQVSGLGMVTVAGAAEATFPMSGIEVFRYTLSKPDPDFETGAAQQDGSFEVSLTALPEDVLVIRRRSAGRASDAMFVDIQP